MLHIDLLCVGGLKEPFWKAAAAEYEKRLGAWAQVRTRELRERPLGGQASEKEITMALEAQGRALRDMLPKDACVCALCVEGQALSSEAFSKELGRRIDSGTSRFCFLIGGSHGLDEATKVCAQLRLSLSPMTLPHMLARVFLLEQIYRALSIRDGRGYHK